MTILRASAFALASLALVVLSGCSKKTESQSTATTSASASTIPSTPVSGKIGGEAFTLKKVTILTGKGFGEWRLAIDGSTPETAAVALRMPVRSPLGVGKTVEVGATPLSPGSKPVGVNIQRGTSNTTTTNMSYRLEITKWDVKPCPTDTSPTHEGGLASGRILVKVPGENVEVAGTFTDAVVSYGETPDWTYAAN
jgi:hypothetical protein